ncbi:MAG TPA: DUF2490 domain-containing protein [Bacteroidales bacterium]|mgnify:CR=1 FL=1|nr:DUF2490 domain-containing protein [Bacteroidales bacterium]
MKNILPYLLSISKLLLLILFHITEIKAQDKDFQIWGSAGIEKKINKKFTIHLEQELRMTDNVRIPETIFTESGIVYKCTKWLKLSGNYRFILKRLNKTYIEKHRFYIDLQLKHQTLIAEYSLRTRYQHSFSDLSNNIKTYLENYIRYKFTISHSLNHNTKPYLSIETFHNLNKTKWLNPHDIRGEIGANYKIAYNQNLNPYFLYQKELRTNKPETIYILGIAYIFSL